MIRIFGDIILDIWIKGNFEKYSPEAPVKILDTNSITYNLGGAANVAANLKNLKNDIKLSGAISEDANGKMILKLLKAQKIKFMLDTKNKITTSKTRLINIKNLHLLRIDTEEVYKKNLIFNRFKKDIKKNDIILLCDYQKGIIKKNTISDLLKFNKNLFIDPKNKPEIYKGAFLVKPNMVLYKKWLGKFSIKKSINLIKKMKWQWLVVTDGKNGVHVINNLGFYKHYKYKANKVVDVAGAGDSFLSTLCHYFKKGISIFECCDLACYASTKTVEKSGINLLTFNDIKK
jgi:D-beta-D-heptose 7-phosphate kinase/D-beta-D-heptose 1-phosphate adenosyltransferase